MERLGKQRHYGTDKVKAVARRLNLDTSHLDSAVSSSCASVFAGVATAQHTSAVGTRTEGIILGALMRMGKAALLPFGGARSYDLAVDDDGRLVRIQCKTAAYRDGCVVFHASGKRRDHSRTSYRGLIDAFAVYCPALEKVYLVPVDHVTESEGRLRVEPAKSSRLAKVRWAAPYEVRSDGVVAPIG